MKCPCQSEKTFETCCQPFLSGEAHAVTAEQLMRSRYSAFICENIDYLKDTLVKSSQKDFNAKSAKEWATESEWLGLKILKTKKGGISDQQGVVEFIATYKSNGDTVEHHEVARFLKNQSGHWKYEDGDIHTHENGEGHHEAAPKPVKKAETVVREIPKVGRNEPCPCGSGKKHKKCCLN